MGGAMSSVTISGDTSGSIILQAPAVSGSTTLTLPTTSGTVLTNANAFSAGTGPAFSAYQSSAQTLSSNTLTKIQFQTEEFDTNNNFDSTTNYRFTPTVDGYYQVNALFNIGATNTSGIVYLYKNGSVYKNGMSFASAGTLFQAYVVNAIVYLNGSSDYIEIYGQLVSGQILAATAAQTYFQAAMIRSA